MVMVTMQKASSADKRQMNRLVLCETGQSWGLWKTIGRMAVSRLDQAGVQGRTGHKSQFVIFGSIHSLWEGSGTSLQPLPERPT
jgi:hypothetical protein